MTSAGMLKVGKPDYDDKRGIFSVDFVFTTKYHVGEDVMQSAHRAIKQQFFTLLHANGFWDHGPPDVVIIDGDDRNVHFLVTCRAQGLRTGKVLKPFAGTPVNEDRDKDSDPA